jgi:hypothetical protein
MSWFRSRDKTGRGNHYQSGLDGCDSDWPILAGAVTVSGAALRAQELWLGLGGRPGRVKVGDQKRQSSLKAEKISSRSLQQRVFLHIFLGLD